jgi:predicted transcriptional regulator
MAVKTQTAIRLNPLTRKALQKIAKRTGETVSEVIRRALDQFVKEATKNK